MFGMEISLRFEAYAARTGSRVSEALFLWFPTVQTLWQKEYVSRNRKIPAKIVTWEKLKTINTSRLVDHLQWLGWKSNWNFKHMLREQGLGSKKYCFYDFLLQTMLVTQKMGIKESKVSRQNCYLKKVKENWHKHNFLILIMYWYIYSWMWWT